MLVDSSFQTFLSVSKLQNSSENSVAVSIFRVGNTGFNLANNQTTFLVKSAECSNWAGAVEFGKPDEVSIKYF